MANPPCPSRAQRSRNPPPDPPLKRGGWADFRTTERGEKGFILVITLSLLLLMAVTAMSLNVKVGMQASMAANRTADVQTYFGQLAVIEQSLWKLTGDFGWRVTVEEDFAYQGKTYKRKILSPDSATYPALAPYADAVILSVRAPDAATTVNKSFRYRIETPFLIRTPTQVARDSAGNLFFADQSNHSVWRIDAATAAITRIAGNGTSGFTGDGGPATQAQLNAPWGVAVDFLGNLYISTEGDHRVRKVSPGGLISTVVNTAGSSGLSGDGAQATAAQLNKPYGLAADAAGNLYIADKDNNRIRKVTVATGIISTVAGTSGGLSGDGGQATAAKLDKPRSVFVDAANDLFIADTDNHRIRKVTVATGIIATVAGTSSGDSGDGGAATSAQLNNPEDVAVDDTGRILIADRGNHRIRRVTSGTISTIAGTGTAGYTGDGGAATAARIDTSRGVAVKSTGEVVIADTGNSCLRQVSISNTISTLPMTVGPALNGPNGVFPYYHAAENKLFLYIADQGNHRVRRLDTATNALVTVAGTGSSGSSGDGGRATAARLNSLADVTVDSSGNLYIADKGNNKIRKVTAVSGLVTDTSCSSGCSTIDTIAGTGDAGSAGDGSFALLAKLNAPEGVFVDGSGDIYIADTGSHRIRVVIGSFIIRIAGTVAGFMGDGDDAAVGGVRFNNPKGIFRDGPGNLYIADTNNHRIRKIAATTNTLTTVAGTSSGYSGDGGAATAARLQNPEGVAVDSGGGLYIADKGNHRIRFVNGYTGTISTVTGTGTSGYNGDNRPAAQAMLSASRGIALGLTRGGGRIFVGDTGNNRVRTLFLKTEPQLYGP